MSSPSIDPIAYENSFLHYFNYNTCCIESHFQDVIIIGGARTQEAAEKRNQQIAMWFVEQTNP